MLLRYLGWVRIGFRRWIPAMIPDSAFQVYAVSDKAESAEADCLALTRNWLAEQKKERTIDIEGDGEIVALLAGTPPWTPINRRPTP